MTQTTALAVATLTVVLAPLSGCIDLFGEGCAEGPREPGSGPQPFQGWELRVADNGAWGYGLDYITPALEIFEGLTGATVVHIESQDTGTALQEAILNKNRPAADILYGTDNLLFGQAKDARVFAPYTSPSIGDLSVLIDAQEFADEDGEILATPADHGYISINYDIDLEGEYPASELPQTLADLAEPQWASSFVTEDPRLSTPGLGFLVATIATFGESGDYTWKDYWADLLANGALVAPDWTTAYSFHFSGAGYPAEGAPLDRTIVVSYTTSPAVEVFFGAPSPPSASVEPVDGIFHQVETVAILRCSPNIELAKEFVDFVLSRDWQDITSGAMAVYPVIEGGTVIPEFDAYATSPSELDAADFTAAELHENLEGWVEEWEALYEASLA